MFETVRPEIAVRRSRALMYETLPVSIAFHALLAGAVMMGTYWKVVFPSAPPRLMALYSIAPEPPPPPPPPPPPQGSTATVQTSDVKPIFTEIVAPTVIPDEIPVVTNAPPPTVGVTEGVEGGVIGGVIGGSIGGVVGGVIGGVEGGVVAGPPPPPDTVVIARDEPLPLLPVSQVYPEYPEFERLRAKEDRVIVRYIIGKNGRVREVTVLDKALIPSFTESAVKAIRTWRFRPLLKDGVPQEVIHELTVYFKLERDA